MTQHQLMKPTDAFADLGRIAFDKTPLDEVLNRIAELAKRTIPGADEVSVTLQGSGGARTAAWTGELALTTDEWQYRHGYGPCRAAAAAALTVLVADTAADRRWPEWADRAVEAGVQIPSRATLRDGGWLMVGGPGWRWPPLRRPRREACGWCPARSW